MDDVKKLRIRDAESVLSAASIAYIKKNDGTHFVLVHFGRTIDFWPTSGKWKDRGGTSGQGLPALIRYLS